MQTGCSWRPSFLVGGSSGPFAALSQLGRAVLQRWIEPDNGGSIAVPKRQAGGLRSGLRIVSTFDNIDNVRRTGQKPDARRLRSSERFLHLRLQGD
jgi:hypothetical protein